MAAVATPASPPTLDPSPSEVNGGSGVEDGAPVTVFHDANNFNAIHPLASEWTLWFTKPPTGKGDNWNELLKEVITFDSVEMFWSIWHNVAKVSELPIKADYHLFKKGVRPEWEDPQNKHGGKWAWTAREKKGPALNDQWLQVMLAAIGETLESEDDNEVMGVVVNIRKGFYRIGLWTRTTPTSKAGKEKARTQEEGQEVLKRIGSEFKKTLKLPQEEQVEFTGHQDSARSGSSRASTKMVV